MPLTLPSPRRERLSRSPLILAVCQVRYEQIPTVSEAQTMLDMHADLGGRKGDFPIAEPLEAGTVNVQIGAGSVQQAAPVALKGWRLRTDDGRWVITLMPDHVSLETTRYTTWEGGFRPRLFTLLDAVGEHIRPAIEVRTGLRYVNRIVEPSVESPRDFRGYIADELLGPVLHSGFGGVVVATQQQIDLDFGQGIRCGMRSGFFLDADRDNRPTYLLDFDVYRQGAQAFEREDIKGSVDHFNEVALQLFQQSVTERMLAYLGEDDASDRA